MRFSPRSLRGRRSAENPTPRPRRRTLILFGVLAVAVGGGLWWWNRPTTAAAQTVTSTVSAQTFKQTVSATGTVAAAKQADLSFAVSGTVTSVPVKAGDTVTKGQVLARLDDSVLAAQVTAAQASVEAASTRLADDEDAGAGTAQLASDRAQLVNAETQLEQAKEDRAAATLRSTINGSLAAVNLAKGDVVSTGGSQGAAQGTATEASFTVVSTGRFVVDAQVATGDIAGVKTGLQAEVTITGSDSADPIYGTVSAVGSVASAQDNGAATFPVTIAITGKQKAVYAGSSATVSIVIKQVDNVIAVPTMALHQDGDEVYVNKQVDGKAVKTVVSTGETYGASTEITKGLADGDVVQLASFTRPAGTGTNNNNRQGGDFPGGGQFGGPPSGTGGGNGPSLQVGP